MRRIISARGREVNMVAIAAKHETDRAVGNVSMNARGDIIDNRGNVKITREEVTREIYKAASPDATAKAASIKDDQIIVDEVQELHEEKRKKKKKKLTEVNRQLRERPDGSQYIEVEYNDGSMKEVEVDKK
jgi:hypothetical protein